MDDWTGEIDLELQKKKDRTIHSSIYHHGALKLMRPFYLNGDDQAYYTILNPGGGYLNGDRYKINITLRENSSLFLTDQSATKIYKSADRPVYQKNEFSLEDHSVFNYFPDPIIAYQNAQFIQKNMIRMKSNSSLFFIDIITPGWSGDGQNFTYKKIDMHNEIYIHNKLIALDHLRLTPDTQCISGIGYMEGYTHLGTCYIISPYLDLVKAVAVNQLIQNFNEENKCRVGVSHLEASGYIIRILADETQIINKLFQLILQYLNNLMGKETVLFRKY